jgi:hypothetical protein
MPTLRTRSTRPSASFTTPRVAPRLASLALAALMTLGVLAGLHTLAVADHAALQRDMAQSAASAPRS